MKCWVNCELKIKNYESKINHQTSKKRTDTELKIERDDRGKIIHPVSGWLIDIRSLYNVGSMFRTADALGLQKLYLSGITGFPPRKEISKTALQADEVVNWQHSYSHQEILDEIRKTGQKLVVLEQTQEKHSFWETEFDFPVCFAVGHEVSGVPQEICDAADYRVEIPMLGHKQSLNVAVAFGVMGFELLRRFLR